MAGNSPLSPQSLAWGISLTRANVAPAEGCWRVIRCDGPEAWGGRVSTFVDVLGVDGTRQVGVRLRWFWKDGEDYRLTEAKPGEPFSVDFVMSAGGNAYGLQVADGQPSDTLWGFGMPHFEPHHVFKVQFLWSVGGATEPELPPPMAAAQHIDEAIRHLQAARGLL